MNDQARPVDGLTLLREEREVLGGAAGKGPARRQANGEVMTYALDGWMVREYPGGRIERLCPVEQFRAEDFPHPGFTLPLRRR